MNKLLKQLSSLIKVDDLMTKDIMFYEDLENPVRFCQERDIDRLPLRNSKKYMLFNKTNNSFIEKDLSEEEMIDPLLNIDQFIIKTKDRNLFFVFKNSKLMGIIHFCDIINSLTYIYFYAIFNIFESNLRQKLKEAGFSNNELLKWLKENSKIKAGEIEGYELRIKSIKLPEFQHFNFTHLIKFAKENGVIKINKELENIIGFRNSIMHHKDISRRQEILDIPNEMLYERKDYNNFIKAYFWLMGVLK